jgi:hypothetical protein
LIVARPKNINTDAAAQARRRIGLETAAAKLRAAGWIAVSPEEQELMGKAAQVLAESLDQIKEPGDWPGDDAPLWRRALWGLAQ